MVIMRKAVESNPSGKSSVHRLPTSNGASSADELQRLRPLPKLLSQCTIIEISSSEEETDIAANGWGTVMKKKRSTRNKKLVAPSPKTSNKLPEAVNCPNKNISKNGTYKGCKNINNPSASREKHVKPVQVLGPQQSCCEIGVNKKRSKAKLRRDQKRALHREQKKNEEVAEIDRPLENQCAANMFTEGPQQPDCELGAQKKRSRAARRRDQKRQYRELKENVEIARIGKLLQERCASNMFAEGGAAQTSPHRDFINEPQPTIIGTDYLGDIYEEDFFNKNFSCNNIEAEIDLWLSIHMPRHNNCSVLLQDYELCSDIIWKDVAGMLIFIDSTKYCNYLVYKTD